MNRKEQALQDLQILSHYKRFLADTMALTGLDFYTISSFVRRYENRCHRIAQKMLASAKGRPNSQPTSNPAPVDLPKQLELRFEE